LACVAFAALAATTAGAEPEAADSTATSSEASPTPSLEELAGKVESLTEQLQTVQTDTDRLKRFKFSGYLQVRWDHAENQSDTVRVTGPAALAPANTERVYIRRGRLKLTYDASPLSQAVLYLDGGQDRIMRLLEAYVTLMDPWTPTHAHQLTFGQMIVPFGYELERSSSLRELPERSRAENVLFPGERDRGVKLVEAWTPQLETVIGVFNGPGINDPDFPTTDPTRDKDVVGRARWSQGIFDVAASYYTGHQVTALSGPDVQTDKTRLGFDAQYFYELPTLGGGTLRAEYYGGHNLNADSLRTLVVPPGAPSTGRVLLPGADPAHLATDFVGWYAMWVQNLGEKWQAAARVERFDPNTDVDHDQFDRVSLGLNYFWDGYVRITAAYDIPRTDFALGTGGFDDPEDNLWTLQVQLKF
jgi:hypothetical protein